MSATQQQTVAATPDAVAHVVDSQRKRAATLTARAALAGVTVHPSKSEDGHDEWIVSRWALTRAFSSLDDLEQWLDQVAPRREGGA